MKGARRIQRPNPGARRFEGTRDDKALATVRAQRCLISGKRTTVQKWAGTYPKVLESFDVIHVCAGPLVAHHVVTKARGGRDTPEDLACVCQAAHDEIHYLGGKRFAAKWGIPVEQVERR